MKRGLEKILFSVAASGVMFVGCAPVFNKVKFDFSGPDVDVVVSSQGYWALDEKDNIQGTLKYAGTNWISTSDFSIGEEVFFPISLDKEKTGRASDLYLTIVQKGESEEPKITLYPKDLQHYPNFTTNRTLHVYGLSTTNLGKGSFQFNWYEGSIPRINWLESIGLVIPGVNFAVAMYNDDQPLKTGIFTVK